MRRWKVILVAGSIAAAVIVLLSMLVWWNWSGSAQTVETPAPVTPARTEETRIPQQPEGTPGGQQPPTSTPSARPSAQPTGGSIDENGEPTQQDKFKIATANGFVDEWLKPGTVEDRAARLRPYATPEEIQTAAYASAEKLPKATRAGDGVVDPSRGDAARAVVLVKLSDGQTVQIAMLDSPMAKHRWLVYLVAPEGSSI